MNRKLAAVSSFYAHQARNGAGVGDLLAAWRTGGRGGWKPFLHHVSKGEAVSRPGDHAEGPEEAAADPHRRRDAGDPGCLHPAAGPLLLRPASREQAAALAKLLGLRHEDIAAAECEISIVPRENANGATGQVRGRTVPVGAELIRLYADYLHEEYGGIDSDYVFVNIWAEPKGQAWAYPAVYDLVAAAPGEDRDALSIPTGSGTFSLLNDRVAISSGAPWEL